MHTRSILAAALVAAFMLAGCAKSNQTAEQTPSEAPTAAATLAETTATPLATESPGATETPAFASTGPTESASPEATSTESPSPQPTMPTPPPGLPPGWEKQYDRVENGPEGALVVRTGSIVNLGYGWPAHFTPFSGKSTPPHPWPCDDRPGAAPGTDRIMLGSGVPVGPDGKATKPLEGYSGCTKRPDNLPVPIALTMGAMPPRIHDIFLQAFVDDFQPVPLHSHFQVTLNGTRIPMFEDTINQLDQTGPIGKLLTLELLPEYWPIVKSGTVNLLFDDPTTGKADGYAVDFARILVNHKPWRYFVTIACNVVDAADSKPIAKADVGAGGVKATTDTTGHCALRQVPAGLVSVGANAVGYDGATQLLDLPAGQTGTANFQLKKHKENVADLKREIEQNGVVRIYGIHFDTASAKLRPDSIASLKELLALIQSIPNSRWMIAGHTDNQGGADYNMGLSDARAHSVVAWLAQHGIAANRITAKGYGFTRPVADNATDAGRALNRRVEVSLQK
ncbi:MAG: OmpA family protein [Candidatus Eremiobacteraeota bacterium]|nr:OmpA family protein [Candidatus Eremiobacteraeota bacterium]